MQMLSLISNQMMTNYQDLQEKLVQTELKFSQELQRLTTENRVLKQEIHSVMQNTLSTSRSGDTSATTILVPTQAGSASTSTVPPVSASVPTSSPAVSSASNSSNDVQLQMMTLLSEAFSKLITVIIDTKTSDSKTEWLKFGGDVKKFRAWYLAILAQLSLAPWSELYNAASHDLVATTAKNNLNGKLYAKIITCLEGQVLQNMVSRKHLRANGLLLLKDLVQTYRPKQVPKVIAAITGEFWSQMKHYPNESVDNYYNCFHELLDDLLEAEEPISTRSAMRHFIFTLGQEFETIQNNFRIGNLPPEWHTQEWPALLVFCRNYSNSLNSQTILKRESSKPPPGPPSQDRANHHKKIRQWFLNPVRYKKELEAEQKKCGEHCCVYHLSDTHPTAQCSIKKECDRILAQRKKSDNNRSSTSGSTGQLRNITEETMEDVVETDPSDMMPEPEHNDTNEIDLFYYARVKNHYLRLVKSSSTPSIQSQHTMKYPIIADSGANFHMFREKEFFTSITPITGQVILGDGTTKLDILGVGIVKCTIGSNTLIIPNVRYVLSLAESIYSLFLHIKQPNHGLESSFESGLKIIFPSFHTTALIGSEDIYLDAEPHVENNVNFSSVLYSTSAGHDVLCRHTTVSQNDVSNISSDLNLLDNLHQYYSEVQTKCQLSLDVPAGFRQASNLQRDFQEFLPPGKAQSGKLRATVQSLSNFKST